MQLPPGAAPVLDAATTMFVAVDSKRGPHVTPDLFVEVDGRLWSFTAAQTLKVKALRRRSHAGVLIEHGRDAVVMTARAIVVDAAQPFAVATSGVALDIPRVTAAFAARHALEMAGGAADFAAGRFGLVPGRWVLLSFEPVAYAIVRDDTLVEADGWGDLNAVDLDDSADDEGSAETEIDVDAVPEAVRHLVSKSRAAIGWYSAHGPLALPARWDVDAAVAMVDRGLFATTGCGSEGPIAVTVDEWVAPGPGGKRGVMLRGRGRATETEAAVAIAVEAERAVAWDGTDTESVGIRDSAPETGHTATVSDPNKDPKKETRAG